MSFPFSELPERSGGMPCLQQAYPSPLVLLVHAEWRLRKPAELLAQASGHCRLVYAKPSKS
jgi:hypothetical protein